MKNDYSAKQFNLPLDLDKSLTFKNYLDEINAELVTHLQQRLFAQSHEWFFYIWGGKYSGKSHLLQACCHAITATGKSAIYLSLANTDADEINPEIFENLENFSWVCLDNVEGVLGKTQWEIALFHLFNRCQLQQTTLLVSATSSPLHSNIQLADLQSRLTSGLIYHLKSISDLHKMQILQLHAKQKGMTLNDECARYLLNHTQRDLKELFNQLEKLDHASLSEQRKLTIPFIKKICQLE